MDSLFSTSSRLPARIIMKISCGGCSQAVPSGQDPQHTPHRMHNLTQLPSSTFASTSLRKSLRYFSTITLFRSVIKGSSLEPIRYIYLFLLPLSRLRERARGEGKEHCVKTSRETCRSSGSSRPSR